MFFFVVFIFRYSFHLEVGEQGNIYTCCYVGHRQTTTLPHQNWIIPRHPTISNNIILVSATDFGLSSSVAILNSITKTEMDKQQIQERQPYTRSERPLLKQTRNMRMVCEAVGNRIRVLAILSPNSHTQPLANNKYCCHFIGHCI